MFVDWISVSQYHGEGVPEFIGSLAFKGLHVDGIDATDPGDLVEAAGPRKWEASYGTSMQIKAHHGWVKVSGNPSRFNRADNLFGFELDECMHRINAELSKLGLPPFQPGQELQPSADEVERGALPRWTGARFSRLDLTRNFETGSELLARLAIRSWQARAAAYMKKGSYGDETVLWHNSRRSVKAYRKGDEMALHCKDSPWIDWARERGIVRHEVALKSRYLSDTGLCWWGNASMGTLHRIFDKETEVLQRADASLDPLAVEACPRSSRVVYAAWLKGENVRELMSRATFYRHRKALLDLACVDIAEPRVTGAVVSMVKAIELRPAIEPDGYWREAA